MIDTDERALDVLEAIAAGGPLQVCCGMPVGGGYDENGNGEPPSCCGQPFDRDDLADAIQHLRRRLAQPDQSEPVATVLRLDGGTALVSLYDDSLTVGTNLYTHPDRTQAPGKDSAEATAPARYVVLKASGSRYAYVNDTLEGRTVKRYDILAGSGRGWDDAERHARRLNAAAPTPPSVPQNGEQP